MPNSNSGYIITSEQQLAALASAARQEIVDVLSQMGTVSVSELAAVLGRPADALYYHLRILKKVGLVQESRARVGAGRGEALFGTISRELRIDYEAARRGNDRALNNVVSSMLRLGIRDFRNALRNDGVAVSGKHRELWALRRAGWLDRRDVPGIVRSIEKLAQSVARPSGKGQLYGITIVLTPLRRRRPRKQGNSPLGR
jgi:predicted transcriptional regulator